MSLQTIEIEAFSGPTSVLIGGGNQPTIVYINQGPAGTSGTVDQTIIDGSTNAVAGNAVFDALALKAPLASPTFTGIVTAPRITGRCDGLEVLCKAGLAIAAGQAVYVTGASGNNIIIGLARANAEATSSKTIGISESTLANNATGYVITEGLMTVSISAPTANEGDPIWLSPATAGSMVFGAANKPFAPNHIVYLGVVTRKTGNTVVEIYVKVQNGAELDELSDVLITSPVAGQALMRGATLWENRSLVSADISNATSAATANTLALRDGSGGVAVSTINNLAITAAANSTLTIDEDKGITLYDSITTEFGGYINTDAGGYIVTGVNGNITTGAGGYIQTGIGGHISTNNGGSFATGTGNLTGPNASGTIALTSDIPTVDATIIDGSANAVAGNAVFDALALKAPLISPSFTTPTLGAATATTINNLGITAGANATLTIREYSSIFVDDGGYIQTSVNGPITTSIGGNISTGLFAPISTTAGGSFATGIGSLTGPAQNGTLALIDPSTGTQTFTGSQIFSSTTRPTSSGTGTPAATSLITLADSENAKRGWLSFECTNFTGATNVKSGGTSESATLGYSAGQSSATNGNYNGYRFGTYMAMNPVGTATVANFDRRTFFRALIISPNTASATGEARYLWPVSTSYTTGRLTTKGIGFVVIGNKVHGHTHDGTTSRITTQFVDFGLNSTLVDCVADSNGLGTVSFYINGTLLESLAGPTGTQINARGVQANAQCVDSVTVFFQLISFSLEVKI